MSAKVRARPLTLEEKGKILLMVMENSSARGLSGAMVFDRLRKDGKLPGKVNQLQVNRLLRNEAEKANQEPSTLVFDVFKGEMTPLHNPVKDAYIIGIQRGRRTYYKKNPGKPIPAPRFWNEGLVKDPAETEIPVEPVDTEKEVPEGKIKPTKPPINPYWLNLARKVLEAHGSYADFTHILKREADSARRLAKENAKEFQIKTIRCWNAMLFRMNYSTTPPHCVCVCTSCQEDNGNHCKDKYTGCP